MEKKRSKFAFVHSCPNFLYIDLPSQPWFVVEAVMSFLVIPQDLWSPTRGELPLPQDSWFPGNSIASWPCWSSQKAFPWFQWSDWSVLCFPCTSALPVCACLCMYHSWEGMTREPLRKGHHGALRLLAHVTIADFHFYMLMFQPKVARLQWQASARARVRAALPVMQFCRNVTEIFTEIMSVLGDFILVLGKLWVWLPAEDHILCWDPFCSKPARPRPLDCSVPRMPSTAVPLHL